MAEPDRTSEILEVLSSLGQELAVQKSNEQHLNRQIRQALIRAKKAGIPKTQAAERLGVHRTTLYRAYS